MSQCLVWLLTIVILILIELATISLTTIWFVISGLVALIISTFIDNYFIQFGVFVILGVFLFITTRPLLTKLIKVHKEKTNADRIIGMNGVVTEKIGKNFDGEVKVDGKKWTAFADKNINVDSIVKVLEIKGVKIKVERIDD